MSLYKAYMEMSTEEQVCIDMTKKEQAAMFAAYDYGINEIDQSDIKLIQSIIDKIKEAVWPDE